MRLKKWTSVEEEILIQNWNIPMRELLAFLPDRTSKTIYWKLGVLGYNRESYRRYTPEEDQFIKKNFPIKGNYEIGRIIKRTAKSIAKRMIVLGVKRTNADLKFLAKKNRGCFKPGFKSKKEIPNGNLRLNFDEITNKNFYDVKINKKFVRFSRYLYEQYNQVVLSNTDIIFHVDGDNMNLLKENLVRINRADLLHKNIMNDDAFIKRIFRINDPELIEKLKKENPDLIDLKRKTILLNHKLNKKDAKIIE
jgi:hypothetical protein